MACCKVRCEGKSDIRSYICGKCSGIMMMQQALSIATAG